MKIRQGFVTNSSSSSYIVSFKILPVDLGEVLEAIKKDYGNKGLTLLFSDVQFDKDRICFRSGREEEIEHLFSDVPDTLYDTDTYHEVW